MSCSLCCLLLFPPVVLGWALSEVHPAGVLSWGGRESLKLSRGGVYCQTRWLPHSHLSSWGYQEKNRNEWVGVYWLPEGFQETFPPSYFLLRDNKVWVRGGVFSQSGFFQNVSSPSSFLLRTSDTESTAEPPWRADEVRQESSCCKPLPIDFPNALIDVRSDRYKT